MQRARGVVVVGSAGKALWSAFRAATERDPALIQREHPLDTFVGHALDRVDEALAHARVGTRRFDARMEAPMLVDFRALGEIAGLGSMGPFGLLIHEVHGPWWALRGAWLVDVEVPPPPGHSPPCAGCSAPCLGSNRGAEGILLATALVRGRCIVGQQSRYSDEQVSYHYDREATLARLRRPGA